MNTQEKPMKLISMVDFVLEQDRNNFDQTDYYNIRATRLENIVNYAKFLSQPLTIEMFVPVDENGNVFSEPKENDLHGSFFKMQSDYQYEKNYEQAKDKVLFEGNLNIDVSPYISTKRILIDFNGVRIYQKFVYHSGEIEIGLFPNHQNMIVQDLISEEVTLTQAAKNKIFQ